MSPERVASVTKQLSQAQVQEYADAVGDRNPIHVDEAFAAASPFGGTIPHGMLVLAAISEMMAGALGETWLAGGRLKVRFKAPARTSDEITASARTLEPAGDATRRFAVECRNQAGELLISGTAEAPAGG